jgi:EF hand
MIGVRNALGLACILGFFAAPLAAREPGELRGYEPGPRTEDPYLGYWRDGFGPAHTVGRGWGYYERTGERQGSARERERAATIREPGEPGYSGPREATTSNRSRGAIMDARTLAETAFAGMDLDGDGELDETEFLRAGLGPEAAARLAASPEARRRFGALDGNADGKLSRAEFLGGVRP